LTAGRGGGKLHAVQNGVPLPEVPLPVPSSGSAPDGPGTRAWRNGAASCDRDGVISALYHAEHMLVFRFVLGMVGDAALAEDLTHDTFLAAHGAVGQLKDLERARAWLYAIARNMVRQHRRRQRLIRWVRWDDQAGTPSDDAVTRPEIVAALARLSPDDREIVLLKGLLEFTAREIALILGVREETAQQRWHRARERFRAALAADGAGPVVTHPRSASALSAADRAGLLAQKARDHAL
jgi:RNA polymerase sigma-70 factor, ECF subfamily